MRVIPFHGVQRKTRFSSGRSNPLLYLRMSKPLVFINATKRELGQFKQFMRRFRTDYDILLFDIYHSQLSFPFSETKKTCLTIPLNNALF